MDSFVYFGALAWRKISNEKTREEETEKRQSAQNYRLAICLHESQKARTRNIRLYSWLDIVDPTNLSIEFWILITPPFHVAFLSMFCWVCVFSSFTISIRLIRYFLFCFARFFVVPNLGQRKRSSARGSLWRVSYRFRTSIACVVKNNV